MLIVVQMRIAHEEHVVLDQRRVQVLEVSVVERRAQVETVQLGTDRRGQAGGFDRGVSHGAHCTSTRGSRELATRALG